MQSPTEGMCTENSRGTGLSPEGRAEKKESAEAIVKKEPRGGT